MGLKEKEIREQYARPSKADELALALRHEEWLRLHVEVQLPPVRETLPLANIRTMVSGLLPADKVETFDRLLRFPLPTNDVTAAVFDSLSAIFRGKNPVLSYRFHDGRDLEDWEWYRNVVLHGGSAWSGRVWDMWKCHPNAVIVVDLPADGGDPSDPFPQPYFFLVPTSRLISWKTGPDHTRMEWVMFRDDRDTVTVVDDRAWRRYRADGNGALGRLIEEKEHGLTITPARFIWSEPLSVTVPDVKGSPLSKELSALDWYVFSDVSKRGLDLSSSYPIYWGYREDCDYSDAEGRHCERGHLVNADGTVALTPIGTPMACPLCSQHRTTGPGSFVGVPAPEEGAPDMRDPVGLLSVDRSSLDYNVEDLSRQRQRIIDSCVGVDGSGGIISEASLADKQVDATYEDRTAVLNRVKRGFEQCERDVEEWMCMMRYGTSFMGADISYGTEFFAYNPDTLRKRYQEAKDSGASAAELDALRRQIIQSEYRNDPAQIERMEILSNVEPYRDLGLNQVLNLWEKGVVDDVTMELKSGFADYIARFERENDAITEFAVALPLRERVAIITKKLYDYAEEQVGSGRPRNGRQLQGAQG